jgi:hypothetical protein
VVNLISNASLFGIETDKELVKSLIVEMQQAFEYEGIPASRTYGVVLTAISLWAGSHLGRHDRETIHCRSWSKDILDDNVLGQSRV